MVEDFNPCVVCDFIGSRNEVNCEECRNKNITSFNLKLLSL